MEITRNRSFSAGSIMILKRAALVTVPLALLLTPILADVAYHQPTPYPSNMATGAHIVDYSITNVYYNQKFIPNSTLQFGGWGDVYRAYVQISHPGLPTRVTKATLVLTSFPKNDGSTPTAGNIFRVDGPWDISSTTWFTQPSATFLRSVPAAVPGQPWRVDVTDLFNAWQQGQPNYGIRIDPVSNNNNFSLFRSSRSADAERPILELEFTSPVPTPQFKLPLPSDATWLVSTEPGGFDCTGQPIDLAHAGDKFFAIDFPWNNSVYSKGTIPVLAAAAGKVLTVGLDPFTPNGYYVIVDHDSDGNDQTGFQTWYVHLKETPAVYQGQLVEQGALLGWVGSTGYDPATGQNTSTDDHLHFAVKYKASGSASESSYLEMEGLLLRSYMSDCDAQGDYIRRYKSSNVRAGTPANRAPTLTLSSTSGSSVVTGQAYSITVIVADADGNLSDVDVNWNDGTPVDHKAVSGSSASGSFTRAYSTARTINWSATAYDTPGLASNQLQGSFTVTVPVNRAATLTLSSTSGSSVVTGQAYFITVNAADADGNLSNIDVNWNDGTPVEHKAVGGSSASVTFTRTYSTARTINWSATAYDTPGLASNQLQGSFTVTAPVNRAPTLTLISTSGSSIARGQSYSITVRAADVDGNLSNIDVNWNDGTPVEHKAVGGSSASVNFTRTYSTARTINWSANAYDVQGLVSNQLRGTFTVR